MTISLQAFIIQLASTFLHEHGIEPSIDFENGSLVINRPIEMDDDKFNLILNKMSEHIQHKTRQYNGG